MNVASGEDVRGFYAALGVQLPGWSHTEAPVRCFADPDAHARADRDASCSVNLASGAFNCHGCGAHGGAYDAALALGRSSREAIDLMAAHGLVERRAPGAAALPRARPAFRRAQPHLGFGMSHAQIGEWARALAADHALLALLRAERGWDARTLRQLSVGFDGERITVPIFGDGGLAQGLLRLRVHASQRPKVLALQGTRLGLIPRLDPAMRRVWLVEGPSDMLAARSAGLPALAVPGTHAWRTEWADGFAGRDVIVAMDADRPGRQAALRIASDLEHHGAAHVRILELAPGRDDGYDLSDWLRQANRPAVRAHTSEEFRRALDHAHSHQACAAGSPAVGGGERGNACLRY